LFTSLFTTYNKTVHNAFRPIIAFVAIGLILAARLPLTCCGFSSAGNTVVGGSSSAVVPAVCRVTHIAGCTCCEKARNCPSRNSDSKHSNSNPGDSGQPVVPAGICQQLPGLAFSNSVSHAASSVAFTPGFEIAFPYPSLSSQAANHHSLIDSPRTPGRSTLLNLNCALTI
jgi:hypothetical protein